MRVPWTNVYVWTAADDGDRSHAPPGRGTEPRAPSGAEDARSDADRRDESGSSASTAHPTRLGTPRDTSGRASSGASRVAAHETCNSDILRTARPSSSAIVPRWWGEGRSSSGVAVLHGYRAATAAGVTASRLRPNQLDPGRTP